MYFLGITSLIAFTLIANPFISPDRGLLSAIDRLRINSYVFVCLLLPAAIWVIDDSTKRLKLLASVLVTALVVFNFTFPLPRGLHPSFLMTRQELINVFSEQRYRFNDTSIVLAKHGYQFLVTYSLGVPSQQNFPVSEDYASVFWLLNNAASLTNRQPDIALMSTEGNGSFALIEHFDLQQRLQMLTDGERTILFLSNSHLCSAIKHNSCKENKP